MKTNIAPHTRPVYTYEGGKAVRQDPYTELRRAVATCLLWEDTFYEKGMMAWDKTSGHVVHIPIMTSTGIVDSIAQRIADLCLKVPEGAIAALACDARIDWHLRHVPLWLTVQLAQRRPAAPLLEQTVYHVIQRPDEAGELLALWWQSEDLTKVDPADLRRRGMSMRAVLDDAPIKRKRPIPAQMKRGIAKALRKFDVYQLGKWDKEAKVTLRGVWKLVHDKSVKPAEDRHLYNIGNSETLRVGASLSEAGFDRVPKYGVSIVERSRFKDMFDGTLPTPDTWEVALSGGANKREVFTRLLTERKMPYMALLMNLRNMNDAGVDRWLVEAELLHGAPKSKALPFRFVAAAKHAPTYAQALSNAMIASLAEVPKLLGHTVIVVDHSGSMIGAPISAKSQLDRLDAAAALAVLVREVCESAEVWTFANHATPCYNYRGLPLVEVIRSAPAGGTLLAGSLTHIKGVTQTAARLIVVTDEQSHDGIIRPWTPYAYLINVAPYKPGLDVSGGWTRVNGWSERVVEWMRLEEQEA